MERKNYIKISQGSARPPLLLSMFGRLPVPLGPVLGHRLAQVGGAVVAGQAGAGRQSLQPGRAVPAAGPQVHQEDGRGGGRGQRHHHLPPHAYSAGFRPTPVICYLSAGGCSLGAGLSAGGPAAPAAAHHQPAAPQQVQVRGQHNSPAGEDGAGGGPEVGQERGQGGVHHHGQQEGGGGQTEQRCGGEGETQQPHHLLPVTSRPGPPAGPGPSGHPGQADPGSPSVSCRTPLQTLAVLV